MSKQTEALMNAKESLNDAIDYLGNEHGFEGCDGDCPEPCTAGVLIVKLDMARRECLDALAAALGTPPGLGE